MNVEEIITKSKAALKPYYGHRLEGLVWYGSLARGGGEPESDIDLLVLLKEPVDYMRELRSIVDLLYDIQLESDRLISAKPAPTSDFEQGTIQLYRNALREWLRV